MKNLYLLLAIAIISTNLVFSQTDEHTEKLVKLYQQKEFDAIIKYKRKKTKIFSAEALYYKAMAYYMKEDDNNALKYFDLAIQKGTANEKVYFYKGITLFYLKKYNESLKCFDKAIDISPDNPDLYALKGEVYVQMNELDSAIFFFNTATQFENCNLRTYLLMGDAYQQQKNYDRSLKTYKSAFEKLEPNNDQHKLCSYNIGLTQQLMENFEEAAKTFERHILLYPKDYPAIAKLIQILHSLQEYDKSKQYKETLYKAYDENKLPNHMRMMYCFNQLKWGNITVFAFEVFDEFKNDVIICKHKFIIPDDKKEMEYKIQSELDTLNGDSIYVLRLIKDDTLYTYHNYLFKENIDYIKLKKAVLDILNKNVEPTNKLSPYSEWIAKLSAEKNNLANLNNDGSSYEKAVIVKNITEEYEWIRKYYPGNSFLQQSLNFYNDKPYDILRIETIDGETKDVYFDISKFFGKGF